MVAAACLLRSTVGGFLPSGVGPVQAPTAYQHWDVLLHSPLCLVLGALALSVTRRALSR